MDVPIIQYNSGDHILGGVNLAEAITTEKKIIFNESYVVVGRNLQAPQIYATYNLTVHADITVNKLEVNGSLFIDGNIEADVLVCHGKFLCTGDVRIKNITVDGFTVAESLSSDNVLMGSDVFVHTTIDTNESLKINGLLAAAEGIMGDGTFEATAAIANEYFDFSGEPSSTVFEVSSMEQFGPEEELTIESTSEENKSAANVEEQLSDTLNQLKDLLEENLPDWCTLDEDDLMYRLYSVAHALPDVNSIVRIMDRIIEISYLTKITNLRDYLYVVWAKEIFPEQICNYETLEGVFGQLYIDATNELSSMEYHAKTVNELSDSLYVLSHFADKIPVDYDECADTIFSSIGLRYSTVQRALR